MSDIDRRSDEVLRRILVDPAARRAYHDQQAMAWLGSTLRQARVRAGLSQAKAAEAAGMTQAELSRVENGLPVKGITFTTLVGLSEALGFNIVFEIPTRAVAAARAPALAEAELMPQHLAVRELV